MIVTANLQSLRIAPRKVRILAGLLKGTDAVLAKQQLRFWAKRSSEPLEKLIDSALANAFNNHGLVKSNMKIKDVIVDGGAVLKRFEPKGFGSASPIAKRTSHITIILEEKVLGLKADVKEKKEEPAHEHKHEKTEKPDIKKTIAPKSGGIKSVARRLFQRKTI